MRPRIVFSDVDGTLLDSRHRLLPGTLAGIRALGERGIPFVIISARSPAGIRPILDEYRFACPMVAYSGGLALDEAGAELFSQGFPQETAAQVLAAVEDQGGCVWNLYSQDTWIVKDKRDPRVRREEAIVRAQAVQGSLALLDPAAPVHKFLCIGDPSPILALERRLKGDFPALSVVRSSQTQLEVMAAGVTKRSAVQRLCALWKLPLAAAAAFGDHYNDAEMLEAVGLPFLMGNAPEDLRRRFPQVTLDNDHEGIAHALRQMGVLGE